MPNMEQKSLCPLLCGKAFVRKGCVQKHIKSVHEGQMFPCMQCEYKTAWKGDLQKHIKSVHEGQKFPCPQCEYKATWKGNLKTHIKSVHKSQKFPIFSPNQLI